MVDYITKRLQVTNSGFIVPYRRPLMPACIPYPGPGAPSMSKVPNLGGSKVCIYTYIYIYVVPNLGGSKVCIYTYIYM